MNQTKPAPAIQRPALPHSSAPWRTVIEGDTGVVDIVSSSGDVVADVYSGGVDANLIATAPELLAAARLFSAAALDAVHALNDAGLSCPASIALATEQASAAIAKAEGRAE